MALSTAWPLADAFNGRFVPTLTLKQPERAPELAAHGADRHA